MATLSVPIRDIHGLDPIPWWPPGPGWWLAGLALAAAVAAIWLLALRNRRHPLIAAKWQRDARRRLRSLRKRQSHMSTKEIAGELSELLRRVAMARFDRRSCAGLAGDEWLEWLASHDPASFDWRRNARILLELPYAPPGRAAAERPLFNLLIDATLAWVSASEQAPGEEAQRV